MRLSKEEVKQAKTDKYIVDRLKAALHQLKQCRSVAEWIDYLVVLAAVAPERETAAEASRHRDDCTSIAKVFGRLGVQPGSRYVKVVGGLSLKRPRAPDRAITNRCAMIHVYVISYV